jgi:hypothetical protein
MATLPQHFMGNYGLEKYQTGKETPAEKKPLRIDTETYETNPLTADYVDFGKDNPYYRGAYYIPEEKRVGVTFEPVNIKAKRTGWGKDVAEYQKKNPLDKFVKDKMEDYIKSQGRFGKNFGVTMENFPENVQQNYINEYYYKLNSYAAEKIAKQKGYNLSKREDWIDKLTPREREIFAGSKYENTLQPSLYSRALGGLEALGNTALNMNPIGAAANSFGVDIKPFRSVPGMSQKESEELLSSPLAPLETLNILDIPGAAVANALKSSGNLSTGSNYRQTPGILSGQMLADVNAVDAAFLNPLNYLDAVGMIKSVPTIGRAIGTGLKSGYNTATKGVERVVGALGNRPEPVDITNEVIRRLVAKLDAGNAPRNLTPLENPQQLRFDFGDVADQYRASASRAINQQPLTDITVPINGFAVGTPEWTRLHNIIQDSRRIDNYMQNIIRYSPSPENLFDIEDLRRIYHNGIRILTPDEYRYLNDAGIGDAAVYERMNDRALRNFREQRRIEIESQPPALRNKSRMTKENAMNSANEAAKDKLSKMSDDEFKQTVITTKGDVVPYYEESLENYFTGPNNVMAISPEQYTNLFNQNLNRLNEIIAGKNTSSVQYRVKELTPGGNLIFETPDQIVNGKNIASGTQEWGVSINPGKWSGEVADIANKQYFRSIPGLEMSSAGAGIFPYREELAGMKLSGTRAYESINDYLKELGLGRVKPGFNSQTSSTLNDAGERIMSGSMDVWKNFIDKDKAVGYYGNPFAIYGVMRQAGGDTEMGLPNTGVNFEDIPDDVLAMMIANNRLK